jgi:hypothetical protein
MTAPALTPALSAPSSAVEFLVLRQDPESREYRWLGVLGRQDDEYRFSYTADVAADASTRPLPGFPDRHKEYRSTELFATFANRVMTPRRDSYREFLSLIGLSDGVADPFEVLARTWGTRVTDRIQVLPVPVVDERGRLRTRFLVHGGRHVDPAAEALRAIKAGDRLALVREPDNPHDPRAVLVCVAGEVPHRPVGYVPAPLVPLIEHLSIRGIEPEVTAEAVNLPGGPQVSNQMRLLARLEAEVGEGLDVLAALDPESARAERRGV